MSIRRPSAYRALLALAALAPLAACGNSTDTMRSFGLSRDAPDEFAVTTRAPLSMPPALGALPVPRPGAVRPQELNQRQQAEATLVPGAALGRGAAARTSSGETALLSAAGQPVNNDIRRRVDEESLRLDRPDSSFVDSMMFWRSPDQPGVPVDPRRESQRLRENAALGRDNGEGETPVIQPARSSNPVRRVLESIF